MQHLILLLVVDVRPSLSPKSESIHSFEHRSISFIQAPQTKEELIRELQQQRAAEEAATAAAKKKSEEQRLVV